MSNKIADDFGDPIGLVDFWSNPEACSARQASPGQRNMPSTEDRPRSACPGCNGKCGDLNARRITNGLDRASDIQDCAVKIERALVEATTNANSLSIPNPNILETGSLMMPVPGV
jgi:hypothetical protein